MTFDERLQLLLQNAQNLQAATKELHARVVGDNKQIEERANNREEINTETERILAAIEAANQRRLDNLEGHS